MSENPQTCTPAKVSRAELARDAELTLAFLTDVLTAAEYFVDTWRDSGLATTLGHYGCVLSCEEADSLAALFAAFDHDDTAQTLLTEHAAYDDCGDRHHTRCPACTSTEDQGR